MAFEAAPISTLLGSTVLEVATIGLRSLTLAFEVATSSRQPSTRGKGPTGRSLCSMVYGAITPNLKG